MSKREYGKLLSRCTSFKIGGPAFFWLEAGSVDDVSEGIAMAEARGKKLAIIGKGSNVLASDSGFDGVIIKLGKGFDYIEEEEGGIISAGAGVSVSKLVARCAELGLGGCEFLAGIPGSLGGAVFMNAGVRDVDEPAGWREIKDIILDVDTFGLKDKRTETLQAGEIPFSYRSSGLDARLILGARIKLEKDKKSGITDRANSFMKKRKWIKKLKYPSAGSVFKNPDSNNPAGRLIEMCGLKGRRIGGAEISMLHANFIVNTGSASSRDVMGLVALAKRNVKEKFGIDLELELKVI